MGKDRSSQDTVGTRMKKKLLPAMLGLSALVTVGFVVLRLFFFEPFRIPQNGMYPNFPAGTFVLAEKRPYTRASDVARGDVVVFIRKDRGESYNYVWRVVGLPGDAVRVQGEQVIIDGVPLRHEREGQQGAIALVRETNGAASYLLGYDDAAPAEHKKGADMVVGPDQLFVLGDNRYNAVDSTDFGPIEFSSIIARVVK